MAAFTLADHRRYLGRLARIVGSLLAGVVVFNAVMDPYDVLGTPRWAGLNQFKHGTRENARIAKVYQVERIKPRTLILGSSRTEMGLNPGHPSLEQPAYNLSVEGASLYEVGRLLQHGLAVAPVERVIIGVDYFAFRPGRSLGRGFEEDRLAVQPDGKPTRRRHNDLPATLVSATALNLSWKTLLLRFKPPGYVINEWGFREMRDHNRDILAKGGHRKAFLESEASVARSSYNPLPETLPAADDPFQHFASLLDICRRRGVHLQLLIYPKHARLQELIRAKGNWPAYQDWKRRLARLVDDSARRPGWPAKPQLWDFSTLSPFNQEAVPPAGDTETALHWYRESTHATQALGDRMLDRIHNPERTDLPSDFGLRLTPETVDAELLRQTAALATWRDAHPTDLAEIAATLKKAGITPLP